MDLFCPHCSSRVTVPDEKAGQVTSCPLCAKQFMTPALPPPPTAPNPPAETYGMGPAAAPPPSSSPGPSASAAPSQASAAPPPPPGEYSRSCACILSESWLMYVPAVCVILIFFLSFFTWHNIDQDHTPSLWGMSFVDQKVADVKQGHLLGYTIMMLFPILPLTIAAVFLDKGFGPPTLAPLVPWKSLLLGLLLGLTLLFLIYDYIDGNLMQRTNPIALAEKLAIRLHFLAMLASFGMFWLHWRKQANLPLPRCDVRW